MEKLYSVPSPNNNIIFKERAIENRVKSVRENKISKNECEMMLEWAKDYDEKWVEIWEKVIERCFDNKCESYG